MKKQNFTKVNTQAKIPPMKELKKKLDDFLESAKKPLVVVIGPTASGKTGVSLKVAEAIDGEIISADSKQIYRGMEIATDTIMPEERRGIPHHMLGIADPDEVITLADYRKAVLQKIEEIHKRKRVPIIVGGTGLYISSIIERYEMRDIPPNQELRTELEKEAEEKGKESVHEKLKKLNPEAAEKIHPNNLRYVIRAIETETAKEDVREPAQKPPQFDTFFIATEWPREKLYERINERVGTQVERGVLEEVKKLLDKGYGEKLPSMSALGVKEYIPYFKGEMPLEKGIETLQKNTRNYAKRQMTWWRKRQKNLEVTVVTEGNIP